LLVSSGLLERKLLRDRPEYRLTARGLATYPYALSLMTWGDDWLAGKDGPPVILKHKACGHLLEPSAICRACKRNVSAADIRIDLENIAETVREDTGQVRVSSRPELYTAGRPTSVSRTLSVIGDRWGFFVLWLALAGVTKFEQFHSILRPLPPGSGFVGTAPAGPLPVDALHAHSAAPRRPLRNISDAAAPF